MHIPNCYWYEIFTASLIAEDSDSNRLSWLEEAKDNAADISSLFISCPSYGTNYQMSHRDMRCIWIIFLQFFVQLDNILFDIVTIHFFYQVCLWICRVLPSRNLCALSFAVVCVVFHENLCDYTVRHQNRQIDYEIG